MAVKIIIILVTLYEFCILFVAFANHFILVHETCLLSAHFLQKIMASIL